LIQQRIPPGDRIPFGARGIVTDPSRNQNLRLPEPWAAWGGRREHLIPLYSRLIPLYATVKISVFPSISLLEATTNGVS
jgi:hypothetical protein